MKKLIFLLFAATMLTACASAEEPPQETAYRKITAEEAKAIMDSQAGYILLDVRAQAEYDEGHIPGAMVIPHGEVAERAVDVLTDKNQLILVYCRSGRRSKIAAETLAELGYTNVQDFGGILDWPYETEK